MEAPSPKQAELPFSEEEKIVMVIDSNRHLEEQVAALKEVIARLRAQLFGKKSERMATGELDITVVEIPRQEAPQDKGDDAQAGRKQPAGRTRRLHVRFTREVWEELAPAGVLANPGPYERIPEENPRTVIRVEVVPRHIVRHVYLLPAYRKIGKGGRGRDAAPIRAAAPATILPGSSIGNSVTAMAVYGKYGLKLPLYRQIREFERLGITGLGEGVLCNWVRAVAKALEPLWRWRPPCFMWTRRPCAA